MLNANYSHTSLLFSGQRFLLKLTLKILISLAPPRTLSHSLASFRRYDEQYYTTKFGANTIQDFDDQGLSLRTEVAKAYLRGLRWVVHYYLSDCPAQSWSYPFHYPPLAVDIARVSRELALRADDRVSGVKTVFQPFVQTPPVAPLAQLLSVLPRTSAHLIPEAARHLVTDEDSPLAENYPELIKVRGEMREARA